jgi:hypothetical protein
MARVLRRRSVHRSRLRARTKKSWRDCACRTTHSSGSSVVSSASHNDGPFQNGNDLFLVHCWATKPLTYQFSSALFASPNDALEAVITDVCVVLPSKEETLPEGYEMVRVSVGGTNANTNSGAFYSPKIFIGFRRRKASQRKDHITKVSVVYKTFESAPEDFEMNLNPLGIDAFLVVQREDQYAFGVSTAPSIVLVFANKGEKAPSDYHVIDKDLNKGSYGDAIYLCYRAHQSVGLCNIPIASETSDWFPVEDLPHFPLPVCSNVLQTPTFMACCFPPSVH